MRRFRLVLPVLLGLCATSGAAQAQFVFGMRPSADTAVGLVPNQAAFVPVTVQTQFLNLRHARLTFVYDPAKIEIEGVSATCCTGLYNSLDTVRAPGRFTVGASGFVSNITPAQIFRLRTRLLSGVTDGTYISILIDSVQLDFFTGNRVDLAATLPGQMCHATDQYGDVDGNQRVDSRDALITLSAAVGLPVTGFNLAIGDVDADALVNSRDALLMLAHSIGQFTPARVGLGLPDACAPLATLADRIVYVRRGLSQDSLFTLAAGSSTPAYITGTGDDFNEVRHPRLAGNGTVVAYECYPSLIPRVCRVNVDGTGFADISPGPATFTGLPDWSPGDTLLLTVQSSFMHRMSPTGTGDALISNAFTVRGDASWNRNSTRIAYSDGSAFGIRTINPDGTGDFGVPTGVNDAYIPRWNVAGDTIAFTRSQAHGLWFTLPAGLAAQRLSNILMPLFEEFDWTPEGLLIAIDAPGLRGIWLLPNGGGLPRRVTRGADRMPSSRRNP